MNMKNELAIICSHCEKQSTAIKCVVFTKSDGIYQFMCGGSGHNIDDVLTIHLSHVIEDDTSLKRLLSIPCSFIAERPDRETEWSIAMMDADET